MHGPTNFQFAYGSTRFLAIEAPPAPSTRRSLVSGGGGTGLCSHLRGICAAGDGHPEDRGALFHAVAITVDEDGPVDARVLQAFGDVRFTCGLR